MENNKETIELREDAMNVLLGQKLGWSCGFEEIDDCVGRINKGQIWLIGAFSNAGKSFYVLNMVNRMLETEKDLKIGIFSTEMGKKEYIKRLVCLRGGFYWLDFEHNHEQYFDKFNEMVDEYDKERLYAPESLRIYTEEMSMEKIESICKTTDFDIIFIDYIQALQVSDCGRLKSDIKDTMPVLSKRIKSLVSKKKMATVLISQLNNSAGKGDPVNSFVSPYSFGKEIYQDANVALLLGRELVNGKATNELTVAITKARDGFRGQFNFYISNGFKIYDKISK